MSLSFSNLLSLLNLSNLLSYVSCLYQYVIVLYQSPNHCFAVIAKATPSTSSSYVYVGSPQFLHRSKQFYGRVHIQKLHYSSGNIAHNWARLNPQRKGNKLGCEGDGKLISLFYLSKCSEKAKSDVSFFFFFSSFVNAFISQACISSTISWVEISSMFLPFDKDDDKVSERL